MAKVVSRYPNKELLFFRLLSIAHPTSGGIATSDLREGIFVPLPTVSVRTEDRFSGVISMVSFLLTPDRHLNEKLPQFR